MCLSKQRIDTIELGSFYEELGKSKGWLLDFVFIETMTLLKRKLGLEAAVRIGTELRDSPLFTWIPLTPELEKGPPVRFENYEDKECSYTDCELLVFSIQLKISNVFPFDDHFRQMPGIHRLP